MIHTPKEIYTIGSDNGSSGMITVLNANREVVLYTAKPTFSDRKYTKEYGMRTRLHVPKYMELLRPFLGKAAVLIERPVMMKVISTVISGATFAEAEMIALELLGIPYSFCSSGDWQTRYLPKSEEDTKILSLREGKKRWKETDFVGDADSAFIALLLADVGRQTIDSWRKEKKIKPKKTKK